MKVLKCPRCGTVRHGVPRRQKYCSVACARPEVLARLAQEREKRPQLARARVNAMTTRQEIYTAGYHAGWIRGYAKGCKAGRVDRAAGLQGYRTRVA